MGLKDKEAHKKYMREYHRTHKEANVKRAVEWARNNKDKRKIICKKYRDDNKDKSSEYHKSGVVVEKRKKQRKLLRYGVDQAMFNQMLIAQGSRCMICGKGFIKTPHIDHDHSTGKIRGLLCNRCNWLLGNAGDSVTVLNNAILYLEANT